MRAPALAYVGLGSNLGDRRAAIDAALEALAALPRTSITRTSKVRETDPVGPPGQGRYLNAVVELRTSLAPRTLLRRLLNIESRLGRVRAERWGPRVIDLDLLLYAGRTIATEELVVPHPRLAERAFALEPLADLAPDLVVPGTGRTVGALLDALAERSDR